MDDDKLTERLLAKLIMLLFFSGSALALILYFADWDMWVNLLLAFFAGRIMLAIVDASNSK